MSSPNPYHCTLVADEFLELPSRSEIVAAEGEWSARQRARFVDLPACMVCSIEIEEYEESRDMDVQSIPNKVLLSPEAYHHGHILHDSMLLDMAAVWEVNGAYWGHVCNTCFQDLDNAVPPVLSLANGSWVGPVPAALQGFNEASFECLMVRRQKVLDTLLWLKDHNHFYRDVTLSGDRLSKLPIWGVPIWLLQHKADRYEALHNYHQYIVQASEDEAHGNGHSNTQFSEIIRHAIELLKKRQGNVFSASRLKDMMWGRVIVWSLPSVMLSIKISGDNKHVLDAVIGTKTAREWKKRNSQGVSSDGAKCDPFLLARMLRACAQGAVEDLLGLKSTQEGVQIRQTGVLGKVRRYLGSMTSGGGGSVTLNLVVWLMNGPSVSCMRAALWSSEFREKVRHYIDAVARGEPSDEEQSQDKEREMTDDLQWHTCSEICPKYHRCAHGRIPQSATTVNENGS
ncbi:hypothetical protein PILCRDRAFT_84156 [Piloderma croceum F 1598]|uniref:DUF6570 domain-containing protein n=1 Tax=Piloderma croceum (strain F 1598) TaxID=765440 RepID=A0A0C3G4H3_PILCF|nr:hypothetical protein PILCRDRAFT_84156 [Piloderma croceum F 1598]